MKDHLAYEDEYQNNYSLENKRTTKFPSTMKIIQEINQYYSNLYFTKTDDDYMASTYMAKTEGNMLNTYRYIIIFVPSDGMRVGTKLKLNKLPFDCIQTKTLLKDFKIGGQSTYKEGQSNLLNYTFHKVGEDNMGAIFKCNGTNMRLRLYYDKRTPDYPDKINLRTALELYKTSLEVL